MNNLTFNELPKAVGLLHDKLSHIEQQLAQSSVAFVTTVSKPVNTKELCKFLSISEATCIRWRKKNRIPYLKIGGSIRYEIKSVVEALEVAGGAKRI